MFFQCKMQDLYSIGENFVICAFANNFRLFFTYVGSGKLRKIHGLITITWRNKILGQIQHYKKRLTILRLSNCLIIFDQFDHIKFYMKWLQNYLVIQLQISFPKVSVTSPVWKMALSVPRHRNRRKRISSVTLKTYPPNSFWTCLEVKGSSADFSGPSSIDTPGSGHDFAPPCSLSNSIDSISLSLNMVFLKEKCELNQKHLVKCRIFKTSFGLKKKITCILGHWVTMKQDPEIWRESNSSVFVCYMYFYFR